MVCLFRSHKSSFKLTPYLILIHFWSSLDSTLHIVSLSALFVNKSYELIDTGIIPTCAARIFPPSPDIWSVVPKFKEKIANSTGIVIKTSGLQIMKIEPGFEPRKTEFLLGTSTTRSGSSLKGTQRVDTSLSASLRIKRLLLLEHATTPLDSSWTVEDHFQSTSEALVQLIIILSIEPEEEEDAGGARDALGFMCEMLIVRRYSGTKKRKIAMASSPITHDMSQCCLHHSFYLLSPFTRTQKICQ